MAGRAVLSGLLLIVLASMHVSAFFPKPFIGIKPFPVPVPFPDRPKIPREYNNCRSVFL
jgi:hypothetical protein